MNDRAAGTIPLIFAIGVFLFMMWLSITVVFPTIGFEDSLQHPYNATIIIASKDTGVNPQDGNQYYHVFDITNKQYNVQYDIYSQLAINHKYLVTLVDPEFGEKKLTTQIQGIIQEVP